MQALSQHVLSTMLRWDVGRISSSDHIARNSGLTKSEVVITVLQNI